MSNPIKINAGLTPPWFTYLNKVKATVGRDSNVIVGPDLIPLGDGTLYLLPIFVLGKDDSNKEKAEALATVLRSNVSFSNVGVAVLIFFNNQVIFPKVGPFTALEVKTLFDKAFANNDWVLETKVKEFTPGEAEAVYPIIKATVVQFFNDDLSDFYQNFNDIATNVFKDILQNSISEVSILPSTEKLE